MFAQALRPEGRLEFAQDVRTGLSKPGQKELPSKYLYDDLGSALFEAITHLPEYGLTRAGDRLLQQFSGEVRRLVEGAISVIELGSGSGKKTKHLLRAFSDHRRPVYYPIDLSAAALARCRQELGDVADVFPIEENYLPGLHEAASQRRPGERLLVLFLGSTIGNFDRIGAEEFLLNIRHCLLPGDALLLAADLVKPVDEMLHAYDDPTGVTAAFNLNLLGRINRELGGNFILGNFAHEARYNEPARRIEMHLRSLCHQTVSIPGAESTCLLHVGETIWTEASHKFLVEELAVMASRTGFEHAAQWVDQEWPFAQNLWVASPAWTESP
jgi:L-histidine N-alpha-methyltransferase